MTWDSYPLGLPRAIAISRRTDKRRICAPRAIQISPHSTTISIAPAVKGRWGVMEQQPGPVNWAAHNPCAAATAWFGCGRSRQQRMALNWSPISAGDRPPSRQEQMHAGLLRPDSAAKLPLATRRCARRRAELDRRSARWRVRPAAMAIVVDYPGEWVTKIQPQGASWAVVPLRRHFVIIRSGADHWRLDSRFRRAGCRPRSGYAADYGCRACRSSMRTLIWRASLATVRCGRSSSVRAYRSERQRTFAIPANSWDLTAIRAVFPGDRHPRRIAAA